MTPPGPLCLLGWGPLGAAFLSLRPLCTREMGSAFFSPGWRNNLRALQSTSARAGGGFPSTATPGCRACRAAAALFIIIISCKAITWELFACAPAAVTPIPWQLTAPGREGGGGGGGCCSPAAARSAHGDLQSAAGAAFPRRRSSCARAPLSASNFWTAWLMEREFHNRAEARG